MGESVLSSKPTFMKILTIKDSEIHDFATQIISSVYLRTSVSGVCDEEKYEGIADVVEECIDASPLGHIIKGRIDKDPQRYLQFDKLDYNPSIVKSRFESMMKLLVPKERTLPILNLHSSSRRVSSSPAVAEGAPSHLKTAPYYNSTVPPLPPPLSSDERNNRVSLPPVDTPLPLADVIAINLDQLDVDALTRSERRDSTGSLLRGSIDDFAFFSSAGTGSETPENVGSGSAGGSGDAAVGETSEGRWDGSGAVGVSGGSFHQDTLFSPPAADDARVKALLETMPDFSTITSPTTLVTPTVGNALPTFTVSNPPSGGAVDDIELVSNNQGTSDTADALDPWH
jgi:hypothetical protein